MILDSLVHSARSQRWEAKGDRCWTPKMTFSDRFHVAQSSRKSHLRITSNSPFCLFLPSAGITVLRHKHPVHVVRGSNPGLHTYYASAQPCDPPKGLLRGPHSVCGWISAPGFPSGGLTWSLCSRAHLLRLCLAFPFSSFAVQVPELTLSLLRSDL